MRNFKKWPLFVYIFIWVVYVIWTVNLHAQLCGIESPCEYEYDCEFLGTICAPIIVFPQWNPPPCNEKGTDTPEPNQEQCAVLRFWIPVWECVFPVGGCGGVRAWPDPDCR